MDGKLWVYWLSLWPLTSSLYSLRGPVSTRTSLVLTWAVLTSNHMKSNRYPFRARVPSADSSAPRPLKSSIQLRSTVRDLWHSCPMDILFLSSRSRVMTLTRLLSCLLHTGAPVSIWNSCWEEHAAGHHHLRGGHLKRKRQKHEASQKERKETQIGKGVEII